MHLRSQAAAVPLIGHERFRDTAVEVGNELLERLRQCAPGKSDRETLERVARIQLGFETIRRVQERNAAARVDDDEVMVEAVRAVRDGRAARRAVG